ncbi:hypothetical protein CALCODRAFT_210826 [Calocera cornea HHB12733]|uniref:Uncharacterized protein n=1 Tax=Calocera cornea HHB12733 TaxID=1353952 RepID=A0A165HEQ5_9BASI|nr:hypothetical protein CALCODRAFT_210826 [Calocera cornea HHB12733]
METSYNTTLPDTSPLFSYFPYAEGDPTEGWDLLYLSSGFAAYEGEAGWGGSAHATRGGAAEVDLTFFGTDIHLYGISLGAATWHTILDSILTPGSPSDSSLLASYTGLEEGTHTLALVVNASAAGAGFAFQGVVVGSGTGLQGATVSNHTVPTTDPSVLLAGQWTAQNSTTVNGTTPGAGTNSSTADAMVLQETPPMGPVMQTTRLGDSAMLTFNGTSITVLGELSPSSGQYYITLNSTSTLQTYTLSAQSQWTVNGAVLFWQAGLETQGETSVWVTNAQEGKALGVGGFVVGQAEGGVAVGATAAGSSATSSRLPTGTIVAIALSITLLIALLFLARLPPLSRKTFPLPHALPHAHAHARLPLPSPLRTAPLPHLPHRHAPLPLPALALTLAQVLPRDQARPERHRPHRHVRPARPAPREQPGRRAVEHEPERVLEPDQPAREDARVRRQCRAGVLGAGAGGGRASAAGSSTCSSRSISPSPVTITISKIESAPPPARLPSRPRASQPPRPRPRPSGANAHRNSAGRRADRQAAPALLPPPAHARLAPLWEPCFRFRLWHFRAIRLCRLAGSGEEQAAVDAAADA